MINIEEKLAKEFGINLWQVENTVKLIDEGNTIPFISRYRKEATGELNDETLRNLFERLNYLRNIEERKADVKRIIAEQGKLTQELENAIDNAEKLTEIEDLYRPFKQKKKTRASVAKARGLEPLAEIIYAAKLTDDEIDKKASEYIKITDDDMAVPTETDAIKGAMDIIAEKISDSAEHRSKIRDISFSSGVLAVKAVDEEKESVYEMYYEYSEACRKIAPHRILAIDRGEKEKFLTVSLEVDEEKITNYLLRKEVNRRDVSHSEHKYLSLAAEDAYKRLISPAIRREIRNELTDNAQEKAIEIFKTNLHNLLMQPLIKNKVVIGLDPGYRTGCKVAVVDETGKVLDTGVIYVTHSEAQKKSAEEFIKGLINKYNVNLISIGNGTASKETEIFTAKLLKTIPDKNVKYLITNEAGASVYSASKLAQEEFPDFDVTRRSAVSIARRVQDPLAELVKIDPKSIGVGQYQHDMNQKRLSEALGGVVEGCVNQVGIDLNTASVSLLKYVSGISETLAKNIVLYREENGKFTDRKQLKKVPKLGPKAFLQCAGFLRITDGDNVLDNTSVHPESYAAAKLLLSECGFSDKEISADGFKDLLNQANKIGLNALSEKLGIGKPTLKDIIEEVSRPGRDPRDDIEQPLLRQDVLSIEDLKPGMEMTGTVRNVIDFGAFVDIGVHQDGLVHISRLSKSYVKHPTDVVAIGDIVKVKILDVDVKKNRISLDMKDV